MDAKEWLLQVRKLDQLINAKLAEREQLQAIATDISPKMNGMPFDNTGVPSQKMENAIIKLIELSKQIDKLIDDYIERKQYVVSILEKLPEKEYGVLHRHYIRYMPWEKIAEDMGYSTVHIWRIKEVALQNLEKILKCN